ncbi:hypothetical protein ACLOJK_000936 [Asimina triloba]
MDSLNSFKGYGKVNEAEEQAFRNRSRRRLAIIAVAAVILAVIIIGAIVGTVVNRSKGGSADKSAPSTSAVGSLRAVCNVTQYKEECLSTLGSIADGSGNADPEEIFRFSVKVAVEELTKISALPDRLAAGTTDAGLKKALSDCKVLFADAIDELNSTLSSVQPGKDANFLEDIRTWVSAAATNQETCLDGLAEFSTELRVQLQKEIRNSTAYTSNSLAIATKVLALLQKLDIPIHRKLLSAEYPAWVSAKDRRLLQAENPAPDVVVAKDGSGQFTTISEAVAQVPKKNQKRFVIYVKAGKYEENVVVDKAKWNVMIYGDGMDQTIVTGSKNRVDGTPTFSTPTFIFLFWAWVAQLSYSGTDIDDDTVPVVVLENGSTAKEVEIRGNRGSEKANCWLFIDGQSARLMRQLVRDPLCLDVYRNTKCHVVGAPKKNLRWNIRCSNQPAMVAALHCNIIWDNVLLDVRECMSVPLAGICVGSGLVGAE